MRAPVVYRRAGGRRVGVLAGAALVGLGAVVCRVFGIEGTTTLPAMMAARLVARTRSKLAGKPLSIRMQVPSCHTAVGYLLRN